MKRKPAALLAALWLALCLAGCTQAGRRTAAQKFLNKDLVAIADVAREALETGTAPTGVLFDGVERVDCVPLEEGAWVAFITGSREDPDELTEVGFYYAPDDQPMGWRGCGLELFPDGLTGEKYTWASDIGVEYYTEFMQTGWYYYEFEGSLNQLDNLLCSYYNSAIEEAGE